MVVAAKGGWLGLLKEVMLNGELVSSWIALPWAGGTPASPAAARAPPHNASPALPACRRRAAPPAPPRPDAAALTPLAHDCCPAGGGQRGDGARGAAGAHAHEDALMWRCADDVRPI